MEEIKLSRHFTDKETACKCGCGYNEPHPDLMDKLDELREELGEPVTLNSVCRCEKHNKEVGGSPTSSHLDGTAADIKCVGSAKGYKMMRLLPHLFRRIGERFDFIHVDVDKTKPQDVRWLY